jgi:dsDNA-binding SOS-regulon protein
MAHKNSNSFEEVDSADNLSSFQRKAVNSLETALDEIRNLYLARRRAKLSASRARGVAGEVRELIKFLSEYGC